MQWAVRGQPWWRKSALKGEGGGLYWSKREQEEEQGEGGGRGGGRVEQGEQWEDRLATQPDRKNELSQINRRVGGVCVGVLSRVQSNISRAVHARPGKKLMHDLRNLESTTIKRAMVRFKGEREKGVMVLVACLGVSQEDMMEGHLWRETLGRTLGSHNATELVGGMCRGSDCRYETTRLHTMFCTKTGWSSFTHNRMLHQALDHSLRESKV